MFTSTPTLFMDQVIQVLPVIVLDFLAPAFRSAPSQRSHYWRVLPITYIKLTHVPPPSSLCSLPDQLFNKPPSHLALAPTISPDLFSPLSIETTKHKYFSTTLVHSLLLILECKLLRQDYWLYTCCLQQWLAFSKQSVNICWINYHSVIPKGLEQRETGSKISHIGWLQDEDGKAGVAGDCLGKAGVVGVVWREGSINLKDALKKGSTRFENRLKKKKKT